MRRTPMIFISLTLVDGTDVATKAVPVARAFRKLSKSLRRMRPPGPEPGTNVRSTSASFARRRMAGDVITRGRSDCAGSSATCATSASALTAGSAGVSGAGSTGASAAADSRDSTALPSVSMMTSGAPTATMSPGSPASLSTVPLTGDDSSTAALSVIMVPTTSSSLMCWPTSTNHSPISDSTVPSPRSGSLKTYSLIPPP